MIGLMAYLVPPPPVIMILQREHVAVELNQIQNHFGQKVIIQQLGML
jgi:hypothetical protein